MRKISENEVHDHKTRIEVVEKKDPETNSTIQTRKDGVITILYQNGSKLVKHHDGTQMLTQPLSPSGSIVTTRKQGYAPVRQLFDPVKARARSVIGLGGTDAMMGAEDIMERTNDGRVTEVLLPDQTKTQTYFERQELPGYSLFSSEIVHMVTGKDGSIVKVKQGGEVVLLTANERHWLNSVGKQKTVGEDDIDHFFELFGVEAERRSGVYTARLDKGSVRTQDEEGNLFIVFANGDSVEKLSVSFDLD